MTNERMKFVFVIVALFFSIGMQGKDDDPRSSYNYQRGAEAFEAQKYATAMEYFGKEAEEHPDNGYAYIMMAYINTIYKMYGEGLTNLDKANKYVPKKDKDSHCYIYNLRGGIYLEMKDTTSALNNFALSIKTDPKQTDAYKDRAQVYFEQDKYDKAEADYKKLLDMDKNSYIGLMGMARILNVQKKWKEAEEKLNHIILLYPENGQPYSYRANTYIGLKDWNKATDDILSAIKGDNSYYLLMFKLNDEGRQLMHAKLDIKAAAEPNEVIWPLLNGHLYWNEDQYENAIQNYKKVNEIETNPNVLNDISECYAELGLAKEALTYINKACDLDTTQTAYLLKKANCLFDVGEKEQAIETATGYINSKPEIANGYYTRGWLYGLNREWDKSIADLTKAISIDPDVAAYYNTRAIAYEKTGKKEAAKEDYKKIVEMVKDSSDYLALAYAYIGLDNYERAKDIIKGIISKDSTEASIYYDAACMYGRMNNTIEAMDMLKKAFKKGYRQIVHIRNDYSMDILRNIPDFKTLVAKYETMVRAEEKPLNKERNMKTVTTEVAFTKAGGSNLCNVKCEINGLPLYFIFDTGASTVSLSQVEASFMVKNGYIKKSNIIGSQLFLDAVGNVNIGTVVNLRNVNFGGLKLNNVKASVVSNQRAPLLLGQTVLGRLGKIEIDNQKQVMKITHETEE